MVDTMKFARLVNFVAAASEAELNSLQLTRLHDLAHDISQKDSVPVNVQDVHDLMNHMAAGRKIEAIKVHRKITGFGLKESKDAVEAVLRNVHPSHHDVPDPFAYRLDVSANR